MTPARFTELTQKYPALRVALVGDFCLDRYLEIDPAKQELSIETGLEVYNVVNVRSQPGGAGTILNNLAALGIGTIYPVGFAGDDGEGMELVRALQARPGVRLDHFSRTDQRRTFTYTKPLLIQTGKPPAELNRLDFKNWTPTPREVEGGLIEAVQSVSQAADAIIVLDQVDIAGTGVVTERVLQAVEHASRANPKLPVIADSRRGLKEFPPLIYKMNAAELARITPRSSLSPQRGEGWEAPTIETIKAQALLLAQRTGRAVFITLAERGMIGADPGGTVQHLAALPVRGPIDIVGAGDAVTANLTAALSAGATIREALELASAAASIAVHQIGTTGTASLAQIRPLATVSTV